MGELSALIRKPLCWLGMCPHFTNEDATGIWGECVHCGKRVGFVSSAELRAYADRAIDHRIALLRAKDAGS